MSSTDSVRLRKRQMGESNSTPADTQGELDIAGLAVLVYSSEAREHPIDHLIDGGRGRGGTRWASARRDTTERIVLEFDDPQDISRLAYEVEECNAERTQEVRVEMSTDGGDRYRQILAQDYSFSPQGGTFQQEDLRLDLPSITHLRLTIVPNKGGRLWRRHTHLTSSVCVARSNLPAWTGLSRIAAAPTQSRPTLESDLPVHKCESACLAFYWVKTDGNSGLLRGLRQMGPRQCVAKSPRGAREPGSVHGSHSLRRARESLEALDGWMRRRLRCLLGRQWKRPRTRQRKLCALGLDAAEHAWCCSANGRGPWWNAGASHLNLALPAACFTHLGLVSPLREQQRLQCVR